ncbi:O-acetylhomoserine aminocarboxypropyltransferase [Ancylobacter dichloromethanicus]|uniref:O-acetylhomoserine aminocarboxypropyltransferase n=1 Tax=Ancylobacter dichloromethanicus TaxID=518825 RepID=A0A9W6J590_9HYPH|nr:O-acetylhomoserine aminocarboxypropyltransferase [Ancylobacter dichloromethanicus]MBS7553960.1 O-acetylhomoserine aminocarboxypropyltransferase [Ancylobacter dichloromethanicus]GLK71071.1 O-acetylhomoserine aminocarboxypropyltransferase [Ancylobacter dichloromethanicus]
MTDTSPPAPGFATLAVHAGAQPDPTTKARATPIYQTTSFVFDDVDHAASLFGLKAFGNIYTRIGNPTNAVLEERVAALEGGTAALAVASGHAAQLLTFQTLLTPGDEFVAARKLYGGSINQFNHAFKSFGWNVVWADSDDVASFERAVSPRTKAIFVESIANPGGIVTDIAAIAKIARRAGVPLIVDNTLATPYLIRPFEHGADIIIHSATKFLGGHGNSIGGVIVDGGSFDWMREGRYPFLSQPRPEYEGIVIGEAFGNFAFAIAARVLGLRDLGPALSPFNAFLILTGIETLPLRIQRHCDNALAVAKFLADHPKVSWVSYPGLPGDRYYNLAQQYTPKGAGAVFTFGLKGGFEAGVALVSGVKLFSHLANIGDTRSLIIHPASTTHRQLADEQKTLAGAGPDVVRLSVGIEDAADIIADLDQALKGA